MKFHDVTKAIFAFHWEHERPAKEVRLHPDDMASIVNGLAFLPVPEIRGSLKAETTGHMCGVNWYKDAAVPLGEIRVN